MTETLPRDIAGEFMTLHEFVLAARMKLPGNLWDFLVGGAETETTLRRNRQALDSIAFRPRVLRGVSQIDSTAAFFGRPVRLPVILAPIGSIESYEPGGTATVAKAAAAFGVPMFASSVSAPGIEETAAAAEGCKVFQLYVRGDDAWVDERVRRAIAAGYAALCLTIDTASYSRRERDIAKRYTNIWRQAVVGREFQAALTWDHIKRFKDQYDIPLILKGIATAEDAALACEHGVDAVYVSNHGGRQLDHGRGTIEVLPEVVEAVRGRARIIIDSGFSRGTDIVKALALGADAVGIGRLYCYALTAAGAAGVVRALELLEIEVRIALALLGVDRIAALDRSYLSPAAPVTAPHVHSAFPLLDLGDQGYGGR
jgi:glycolate oxidase